MKAFFYFLFCIVFAIPGCTQNSSTKGAVNHANSDDVRVGGSCEGCEAIFESQIPFDKLSNVDTILGFSDKPQRLYISGTIFKSDGKTPASDVILYVYHTDEKGLYSTIGEEKGWGKRHGSYRGWIKTGKDGKYTFYTFLPASYPNSSNPKHIHPIVKEPGKTAYWIDEFLFDDDPVLPASERTRPNAVGGSGLLKPVMKDGMLYAQRDIILGKNVSNYR